MTEQDQQIAIAEAYGWERVENQVGDEMFACGDLCCFEHRLPDYPRDLNAMHDACKRLDIRQRVMFYGHLYSIVQRELRMENYEDSSSFALVNATSGQRAEAFLRTIGKWKD